MISNIKEDYYIIRNKDTGLYFRGKGVNRWGKYFNQASIYRIKGSAEFSLKEITSRGEHAELIPIKISVIEQEPAEEEQDIFTPDQVRRMTHEEVRNNYHKILRSMNFWNCCNY